MGNKRPNAVSSGRRDSQDSPEAGGCFPMKNLNAPRPEWPKTVLSLAKLSVIIENIDNLRHLSLLFWHPLCWG
jgi:hypothetical protein